jgi:glycosyltransferase involved in cell wall biosynthesis
MRILQLCYEFPPLGGGASRVVAGLSRELARRGHDVHVVTMAFRHLRGTEVHDGVTVHRVPCIRLVEHHCTLPEAAVYLGSALRSLDRIAGGRPFEINHTHFILPDGWLAERLHRTLGLRYIITAHGSDVPGYNPDRLRLAHKLARPFWRRASGSAEVIVCPSRSIETLVRRQDPLLPTSVIPYGVDSNRFRADAPRLKRILVVSRLLKRKGVQYLLRAVDGLPLEHEIHIVGDGPYLSTLRQLAAKTRANVVFHGWLDNDSSELRSLFENSDIFVLPSERENFPVALMEAMVAGLAIITTRDSGCEEVVGETGVLVGACDVDGLRAAVAELAADAERCRALGRAARARAERDLSWEAVADSYLELYARHSSVTGPQLQASSHP